MRAYCTVVTKPYKSYVVGTFQCLVLLCRETVFSGHSQLCHVTHNKGSAEMWSRLQSSPFYKRSSNNRETNAK